MRFKRVILSLILVVSMAAPLYAGLPAYAADSSTTVYSETSDGDGYGSDATYATAQSQVNADAVDSSGDTMTVGQRAASSYSTTIYSTTSDNYIFYKDASYSTCWNATSGTLAWGSSTISHTGQTWSTAELKYYVYRSFLYFDTSAIPDDATITSATLNIYGFYDDSVTDFDITIQDGQPTYPHDPLVAGDFDRSNYSSDGGTLNTSSFSTGAYNAITLNATGRGWIDLDGTTKLCLRSSREIAGTTPTGGEYVGYYDADRSGTSQDPYLSITYTTPTSSEYNVNRMYLYFDTSALPDSASITSATIRLYGESDNSDTDFNIQVQDGQPTYPHDPLVVGDYDESNYSGNGGTLSTSGFTTSGYNEISLNSTGISWISLTGTTKLCLRSDEDISASAPTGDEYVTVYTADYAGTDYDPQLLIYYTADAFIITRDATSVSTTTATLQGELTSLEGETYVSVYFEYGSTTSYGSTTVEQSVISVGTFSQEITGLRYEATYHFRAVGRIGDTTFYGEDYTFTTLFATGSSTDLVIVSAGVFSNYQETGDMLFCLEAINTYSGYYPSLRAGVYFTVEVLDTDSSTILAASPLSNWGDRPSSIYVNATQAADMVEGSSYYIRMISHSITGNPYVVHQLSASEWYGFDGESLDSWCIGVATNMQVSDGRTDYLTVLTGEGVVIDDAATGYFSTGIPGIIQVRPQLFNTATTIPEWPGGTDESSWDSPTEWQTAVGSNIAADAAILGTPFGINGKDVLAVGIALTVFSFMLFVVGATGGFGGLGAILISTPLIWLGVYFRIIPDEVIVLMCMFFGALAIRQFVVKTT